MDKKEDIPFASITYTNCRTGEIYCEEEENDRYFAVIEVGDEECFDDTDLSYMRYDEFDFCGKILCEIEKYYNYPPYTVHANKIEVKRKTYDLFILTIYTRNYEDYFQKMRMKELGNENIIEPRFYTDCVYLFEVKYVKELSRCEQVYSVNGRLINSNKHVGNGFVEKYTKDNQRIKQLYCMAGVGNNVILFCDGDYIANDDRSFHVIEYCGKFTDKLDDIFCVIGEKYGINYYENHDFFVDIEVGDEIRENLIKDIKEMK